MHSTLANCSSSKQETILRKQESASKSRQARVDKQESASKSRQARVGKQESASKRRQARVVKQESASKSRQARIDKQESISKNEIKAVKVLYVCSTHKVFSHIRVVLYGEIRGVLAGTYIIHILQVSIRTQQQGMFESRKIARRRVKECSKIARERTKIGSKKTQQKDSKNCVFGKQESSKKSQQEERESKQEITASGTNDKQESTSKRKKKAVSFRKLASKKVGAYRQARVDKQGSASKSRQARVGKQESASKRRQARVVKQESASKSRQARIDKQESISKNEIKAGDASRCTSWNLHYPYSPDYTSFIEEFHIPSCYEPLLPANYAVLYLSLYTVGIFRLPFNKFYLEVLNFFKLPISLLTPFDVIRLSSFADACKAYGGTFSFPFPSGTPDMVLRSRLLRYPIEAQIFPETILYPAGLAYSWVGSPQHLVILVDGHDYLHFPRGRHVTIVAVSDSNPLFVGNPDVPVVDLPGGPKSAEGGATSPIFVGRRIGFLGPLAGSKETGEVDPFLPTLLGDDEARISHDILRGLPHSETQRRLDRICLSELANFHDVSALRFVMSSKMLNREVRSLFAEASRLCGEVFSLGNQRADFSLVVSRLEAKLLSVDGETESLCTRCFQFEGKEVAMLATEASLKAELEKEKSVFVSKGRALKEEADMGIGLKLEDMRDYTSDTEEVYDKAIDDFYRVEFPYLDLLAYHAKRVCSNL
ncbi:hypothetical protein Tco_1386001 [Tanacetum coccineum]